MAKDSADREIDDPAFGPIEVDAVFTDADTFEQRLDEVGAASSDRIWPVGEFFECPRCGEETFEGCDDLTYRVTNGKHVISFRHLHGARCTNCDASTLEPYEQIGVDAEAGVGFHADYEAKVSRIGSGTLGTYWPKDVQRVLGLKPHKRAFIEIIDRDAVLVRFTAAEEPG